MHGWAFDGERVRRWGSSAPGAAPAAEAPYGAKWAPGNIVGCLLDLDGRTISFTLGGVSLGVAFRCESACLTAF